MRELLIDYGDTDPTRRCVSGDIEIEAYPPNAAPENIRGIVLRAGYGIMLPPHARLEFSGGR